MLAGAGEAGEPEDRPGRDLEVDPGPTATPSTARSSSAVPEAAPARIGSSASGSGSWPMIIRMISHSGAGLGDDPGADQAAVAEHRDAVAEALDLVHPVADEDDREALGAEAARRTSKR